MLPQYSTKLYVCTRTFTNDNPLSGTDVDIIPVTSSSEYLFGTVRQPAFADTIKNSYRYTILGTVQYKIKHTHPTSLQYCTAYMYS